MSAAGRGFCPESLHGMATLLPQHRAFLALVGGGLGKAQLNWERSYNHFSSTGSLNRPQICGGRLYIHATFILLSASISWKALRLCILLSVWCSLFFQTGVCIDSEIIKWFLSSSVLLLGILSVCMRTELPAWCVQWLSRVDSGVLFAASEAPSWSRW